MRKPCLFQGALRADSANLTLRHLPASKFLQLWSAASQGALNGATVQKVITSSEAMVNGTKMSIEPSTNILTVEGDAHLVALAKSLAKDLDVAPIMVRLNLVRLKYSPKNDKSALEILGGKNGLPTGEKAIEQLLRQAAESGVMETITNANSICANHESATFATGSMGHTFETVVIPLVNSKQEITLALNSTSTKGDATSTLASHFSIPNGGVVLTEGSSEKDTSRNRVENLILVQARTVQDEAPATKGK